MRLVLAGLAVAGLTGCSGSSCGELPGLSQERDGLRTAYADLVESSRTGGATAEGVDAAHDRMHALEERVHDLQQSCD